MSVVTASAFGAVFVAVLAAAGCVSRTATWHVAAALPPARGFVGSRACAGCHQKVFDIQSHSRHALTMHHVDRKSPDSFAPHAGRIPNTPYSVTEDDSGFRFASADPEVAAAPIAFALGSGASNVTYIGQMGANHLTEFRMSYNPSMNRWYYTPGQEDNPDLKLGKVYSGDDASRCVLCHADILQPGSVMPSEGSLGVGCESCHGPGAEHITAMRSGPHTGNMHILNPAKLTPHEINTGCGRCHRNLQDVMLTGLDGVNTPRYQVYGLETSSCFRKSDGKISCITCHDAHSDASTDVRHYESVCLSCHSSSAVGNAKACPINSAGGCINCHMPKRKVMPFTKIPLTMADHLIWAYRPGH